MLGREYSFLPGVRGSCSAQAPWGALGTGRLQPHSPFLQEARGGHHHLTFPVGETESEHLLSSFPRGKRSRGAAGLRGRQPMAHCKTTHLSSRLSSGTSGTPLTPRTLEEERGVVRKTQHTPLGLEPQASPTPALTVGPRSPRGPDFPDRPWWEGSR